MKWVWILFVRATLFALLYPVIETFTSGGHYFEHLVQALRKAALFSLIFTAFYDGLAMRLLKRKREDV